MKVDGTCHCGRIAFEAEIDPSGKLAFATVQTASGSPAQHSVFRWARQPRIFGSRGSPREYIKTADSGARRVHRFCGECGTPIFATSADDHRIWREGRVSDPACQIDPVSVAVLCVALGSGNGKNA